MIEYAVASQPAQNADFASGPSAPESNSALRAGQSSNPLHLDEKPIGDMWGKSLIDLVGRRSVWAAPSATAWEVGISSCGPDDRLFADQEMEVRWQRARVGTLGTY
jgi:hypothetical protein